MKTIKTKSGKTYTKKQICEAIAYWKKQLKKMDESVKPQHFEWSDANEEKLKNLWKANPYRISFNFIGQAQNSYTGGLIGAASKEALKQCVNYVAYQILTNEYTYTCSNPFIGHVNDRDVMNAQASNTNLDVNAIVDNVLKGRAVSFKLESDEVPYASIVTFTINNDDYDEFTYDDYWFEITKIEEVE